MLANACFAADYRKVFAQYVKAGIGSASKDLKNAHFSK
jgi:hypothetical protein